MNWVMASSSGMAMVFKPTQIAICVVQEPFLAEWTPVQITYSLHCIYALLQKNQYKPHFPDKFVLPDILTHMI